MGSLSLRWWLQSGFSYPHNCLPSRFEFARDLGNAGTGGESLYGCCSCLCSERRRPAKLFACGLGPDNSRLRALDQQVPLEFGHSGENLHGHLSCWAGEINATKCKAMHAYARACQLLDGCPDIHRIAPKPVKLGDDKNIPRFHPVNQLHKAWPLFCGHGATDGFFDKPARLDGESGRLDLQALILGGLVEGRNAAVRKDAWHGLISSESGVRIIACIRNSFSILSYIHEKHVRNRSVSYRPGVCISLSMYHCPVSTW